MLRVCKVFSCVRHGSGSAEKLASVSPCSGGTATAGSAAAAACADTPDASRYFEGFIDEVRLFKGAVKLDWTKPEAAGNTALAYYKFNPDSGPSQAGAYTRPLLSST